MQADPRYAEINDGFVYPALSGEEARRACSALVRLFGKRDDASANQTAHMHQLSIVQRWTSNHGYRRCWVSTKPRAGHRKGWGRLIHDVSHMVMAYRHPSWRPHEHGHEKIEATIKAFVHNSGWLNGLLMPGKPTPPAPSDKLAHLVALRTRWEAKQSRARKAIAKLNTRIKYYERKAAA